MTTVRCDHGELYAVCRQCPPFDAWPLLDDEDPWTITPAPDRSWSGYALLACVVVGVLVILLAGVRR